MLPTSRDYRLRRRRRIADAPGPGTSLPRPGQEQSPVDAVTPSIIMRRTSKPSTQPTGGRVYSTSFHCGSERIMSIQAAPDEVAARYPDWEGNDGAAPRAPPSLDSAASAVMSG